MHPYLSNNEIQVHIENLPKRYIYDLEPCLGTDSGKITIQWNYLVQTDRRINYNEPDILEFEKNTGTISIINIANISKKRPEDICIIVKEILKNFNHEKSLMIVAHS